MSTNRRLAVIRLALIAISFALLQLETPSVSKAKTAASSRKLQASEFATPKILKVLKKGKASELKRVLVKMQDNKKIIICFRAEGDRFYVTGTKKSDVYGDINSKGRFQPTGRANEKIIAIIKKVEKDPVAYARSHGEKTGRCCFCSRKLTDTRSVAAGYGPNCAEHYGFPWGE